METTPSAESNRKALPPRRRRLTANFWREVALAEMSRIDEGSYLTVPLFIISTAEAIRR